MLAQSPLQKQVDRLAADPVLRHGGLSVCVLDVASGKMLAGHDAERGLIPASSLKVVTTATALAVLGEDFRFETVLEYDGQIDQNGVLRGNLYLKGYGDPTLASDHFKDVKRLEALLKELVVQVQAAGIRRIDGKVIGDASFFGTQTIGRTWLWEDVGNYYGAGAWGLNICDNRYLLTFGQKTQLGAQPNILKQDPKIPNFRLVNELQSAERGSGDNAYIFVSPYSYTAFVRGTIPVGTGTFTIKGAITDPPFFAAYQLLTALENAGVATRGEATSLLVESWQGKEHTNKRTAIHTVYSPTLRDIVVETNMKSVNLYCEAMLRYLGWHQRQEASPEAGLEVIQAFWKKRGIDLSGFFMADGSGLSPFNTVSARHLASIMTEVAKNKTSFPDFRESLPLAGRSGSMRYLLKDTPAEGRVWAKSGGMRRVRSYTGYALGKKGQLLAFSVIANHFTCSSSEMRRKLAQLMRTLCQ